MGDLLAVYGSLRSEGGAIKKLGLGPALSSLGPCRIPGRLFDLGDYPGLVAGRSPADQVVGEILRVDGPSTFAVLDRYEGFEPNDPDHSLFVRRRVALIEPGLSSWLYVYNGPVADRTEIDDGNWLNWLELRL